MNFIQSTYINAAALRTNGLETQLTYALWLDPMHRQISTSSTLEGKLSFSLDVNYLFHLRQFPFQTDPTQQHVFEGEIGTPQLRFLASATYEQGPWSFDWQVRYVDKSARFNKDFSQADFAEAISPAYVPAQVYNNLVIHYRLPTKLGRVEIYAGANDIFDVQPPIGVIAGNPTGGDGDALYDLGRYIFTGVRAKF